MFSLKNCKHVSWKCPECKSTYTLLDTEHGVIFCASCGLVLKDLSKIQEYKL